MVCGFAENYSLTLQNKAQYHHNNVQTTICPFIYRLQDSTSAVLAYENLTITAACLKYDVAGVIRMKHHFVIVLKNGIISKCFSSSV